MYSVEEVLNFTVKDIHDLDILDVEGWSSLSPEKREECLIKLRDLGRQRDESTNSNGVDAIKLDEMLRQIASESTIRSPSPSSEISTPPADGPEYEAELLRKDREAHDTLVQDGFQPSHPVQLGFDIFNDPGEYTDIVAYWQGEPGTGRCLFLAQLQRWNQFRAFQQRIRQYYLQRNQFSDYEQKVSERRRRHRLEGEVELRLDRDEQTKLDNWMEYQDYESQTYDHLQKKIGQAQEELESAQKELREAGILGFDGLYKPGNFGNNYALCVKNGNEETEARSKRMLVEQLVELAGKRLEAAKSDRFGQFTERAAWIMLAQQEFESAQLQFDELEKSQKDCPRDWNATEKWYEAREKMKWAEEGLKAAREDNIGESIEKPALVLLIQQELDTTQKRLAEARQVEKEIDLKGNVLGALIGLAEAQKKFERHKILVRWIEEQRLMLTSEPAMTALKLESRHRQSRVRRSRSKVLPSNSKSKGLKPNKSLRADARTKQHLGSSLLLGPTNPSKVSKDFRKKRIRCHETAEVPFDASMLTANAIKVRADPKPRTQKACKANDAMPTSLRRVRSSRVSKVIGKNSTEIDINGTKVTSKNNKGRMIQEGQADRSYAGCASQTYMQPSASARIAPRRSSRISRKPARFCPG